jgi:hypothetical protein
MGYTNKDFRLVVYKPKSKKAAKRMVRRLRRRAEQRETAEENVRGALPATRRGWWHA